jgi:hypothetical protein
MKTLFLPLIILILALTFFFPEESTAQYIIRRSGGQQPQSGSGTVASMVDATVFPLGALVSDPYGIPTPLDTLYSANLNCFAFFSTGTTGNPPSTDTLLGIQGGSLLYEYGGYQERRMYFFSGYRVNVTDTIYDWGKYQNFYYDSIVKVDTNQERYISETPSDTLYQLDFRHYWKNGQDTHGDSSHYSGKYVLRAQHDMEALYYPHTNSDDTLCYPHYFDFIYRFDTTKNFVQWQGLPNTLPIYKVELWLRAAKDSSIYTGDSWKPFDTIIEFSITKAMYWSAMSDPGSDSMWHHNDLEHSLRLGPLPQNKPYVRFRIKLSTDLMRKLYKDGFDSPKKWNPRYIGEDFFGGANRPKGVFFDFRLRKLQPIRLYVKGLRMREGGAERLLTGQMDAKLQSQFDSIEAGYYRDYYGTVHQGNYYNNLLNIHLEQEPFPNRYCIIGYLDRYARDHGYKRLTSFSPQFPREIRLTWDDILWTSASPLERPQHLYRNFDYTSIWETKPAPPDSGGNGFMPLFPEDALPKNQRSNTTMYLQKIASRSNLKLFERQHDSVFLQAYRKPLKEVNKAAFETGSGRTPFWVMGQAYAGYCYVHRTGTYGYIDTFNIYTRPDLPIDTMKKHVIPAIQQILMDTSSSQADLYRHAFNPTYLYDTTRLGNDRGSPTAEEIRLEANTAAAWGAKGFNVSNAGNDGGIDMGFSTFNKTASYDVEQDGWDTTKPYICKWVTFSPATDFQYVCDSSGGKIVFRDTLGSPNVTYRNNGASQNLKAIPFSRDDHNWVSNINISTNIADLQYNFLTWTWLPTFYGFKTRHRGVQWGMSDLNRAATQLAKLTWLATFDYSFSDGADTVPSGLIPIKTITGVLQQRVRIDSIGDMSHYADSINGSGVRVCDSLRDRMYEVGAFIDSSDIKARYVYIVNRHVWPNRPKDDSLTDSLYLGNAAVRRALFTIDPTVFGEDSVYTLWQITDLAAKRDSVIKKDSAYGVILEPGEGRLFRIAPALGLPLGQISSNLFNNGRHIAAVETPFPGPASPPVVRYHATYENGGKIAVSYPIETPLGPAKRIADNPVDSIIDNSGNCFHPAIAYNANRTVVGLVYEKVFQLSGKDSIAILYRSAHESDPYNFSAAALVDTFTTPSGYRSPPAIAPKMGSDMYNFWVAYNRPDSGEVIVLLDSSQSVPPAKLKYFWAQRKNYVKFVSIATHRENDTCRGAFEEHDPFLGVDQIWYVNAFLNGGGNIATNELTDVSYYLPYCHTHYPQVATLDGKNTIVTFQAITKRGLNLDGQPGNEKFQYDMYAVFRERTKAYSWKPYYVFHARRDTLDQNTPYDIAIYPNTSGNIPTGIPKDTTKSPVWRDQHRLLWSDPILGRVNFVRHGFSEGSKISIWETQYTMLEESREAAMPVLSYSSGVVHPITYKHPNGDGSSYGARITRFDFPLTPVNSVLKQFDILTIKDSTLAPCFSVIKGGGGDIGKNSIIVGHDVPLSFSALGDSLSDTVSFNSLSWNDRRLRTQDFSLIPNDTLRFKRFFAIGNFESGDTTQAEESLADTTDFISGHIYLRKVSNDSILVVMDSCRLTKSGFVTTTAYDSGGSRKYISAINDSVYMTLEMNRGVDTNGLILTQSQIWGGDLVENVPTVDSGAFKKADPRPSASAPSASVIVLRINPNPFTKSTHIGLDVPKDIPLSVIAFDVLGKVVTSFHDGAAEKDHFDFTLDGNTISPGAYFVRVQAGNEVETRKVQFVK